MKCVAIVVVGLLFSTSAFATEDARNIIKQAIDHFRGETSFSVAVMTIHRPDWERSMEMKGWTEGTDKSLMRITSPAKDAGNGTLLVGDDMWSYNPKINRVIKIPSSMAQQSWMGSDFSNNDVARADDLLDKYDHTLVAKETHDNKVAYVIESVPHEDAPVVWGKEVTRIRDDNVVLEHAFYDQNGKLVKKLSTIDIKVISGRALATSQRMQKVDVQDEWTEFALKEIRFGVKIPAGFFTLGSLSNPRN